MIRRSFLTIIVLMLLSFSCFGQKFVWELKFDVKLDNREYQNLQLSPSKTLFGAFVMPQIGINFAENHSFMLGGDLMRNFGSNETKYKADLIFYYKYDSPHYKVYAGIYPTAKLIGGYSHAIFCDDIYYYDTNFEGAMFQYKNDRGYSEVIFDWLSMFSHDSREIFAVYSASKYQFGWFHLGYGAYLNHYSVSERLQTLGPRDYVVDLIHINPIIGISFSKWLPLDVFDLDIGWHQTFQRDRYYVGDWIFPKGGHVDISLEKWRVGLSNSLYIGENLMPYYYNTDKYGDMYGGMLYFGELFYSTNSGLYDRLEAYWKPVAKDFLDVKLSCVFNFDKGGNFAWQQLVNLSFKLDGISVKNIKWKKDKKDKKDKNDKNDK